MKGSNATFVDLALQMHQLSTSSLETRPVIHLSRKQLNRWFLSKNGKQLSPLEKPLDTPKHCKARKQWALKNYGLLTCPLTPIVFLDEKWFYRVNRRGKSITNLPLYQIPYIKKIFRRVKRSDDNFYSKRCLWI